MAEAIDALLRRWVEAGVVDLDTAARIRSFELTDEGTARLRFPGTGTPRPIRLRVKTNGVLTPLDLR